jgi:hypothetical protein
MAQIQCIVNFNDDVLGSRVESFSGPLRSTVFSFFQSEKLIAELRGEIITLKDKVRFLQADVAKLKKGSPAEGTTP